MTAHETLSLWEAFYVIVGSSAGALTGLQFVVITLVAESEARAGTREIAAFGTPTVFHFVSVLLVSAILSAPWPRFSGAAISVGILGLTGVAYAVIVARRARGTTMYRPVPEDWIWHVVLPLIGYAVLIAAAVVLPRYGAVPLFVIAGAALLLLAIGIHNAWDTVTYVTLGMNPEQPTTTEKPAPAPSAPTASS